LTKTNLKTKGLEDEYEIPKQAVLVHTMSALMAKEGSPNIADPAHQLFHMPNPLKMNKLNRKKVYMEE